MGCTVVGMVGVIALFVVIGIQNPSTARGVPGRCDSSPHPSSSSGGERIGIVAAGSVVQRGERAVGGGVVHGGQREGQCVGGGFVHGLMCSNM